MTNAERIRSMTDEELAYGLMNDFSICDSRSGKRPFCDVKSDCRPCIVDWLKSKYEA